MDATQNPWSKSQSLMSIHFFASVLYLTQLYSAQMCAPEPPNVYLKTINDSGRNFQICQ